MHPHSLLRLSSRVYNTPHLITRESLSVILDYLDSRNSLEFRMDSTESPMSGPSLEAEQPAPTVGLLRVDGSLTYKPVMTMCGEAGTSYQSLVAQTEQLIAQGVKTIVMEVSSGGGEASHVFETANDIRSLCDDNNIKLIGYADTMAASAAYALISVCDVVIANPSAQVGSIGCVVALLDTSVAMEKAGLKRIFVTSGESKVPFDDKGAFKQSFLDDIQARVDELNDEFTAHVSKYTGLSPKTITGFEAKVFSAQESVKLGLVNKVMTTKEFAQFVEQLSKETNEA